MVSAMPAPNVFAVKLGEISWMVGPSSHEYTGYSGPAGSTLPSKQAGGSVVPHRQGVN